MKNRHFILLMITLLTIFTLTACSGSGGNQSNQESTQSGNSSSSENASKDATKEASQDVFAMDTYMTVTAYGAQADEAVDEAISEINRLDALWSVGNEDSEISQINEKGSLTLSEETATLVKESLMLYQETDGLFDITIYPLMVEWGFTDQNFKVPSQERIDELLQYVNAGALDFNEETRTLNLPANVKIDLGGIAKGYTSAHIMDIFEKYDITSGLVSLGGNVQVYHKKTDGSLWRVAIENPDSTLGQLAGADYVGIVQAEDKAVITSGGYERYFEQDGVTYHHILDPRTGYPSDSGLISVTIVSDDGLLADGLSTSLFIMGKDKAIDFWREHQDEFDAILIDEEGNVTITAGLKDSYTSDLKYDVAE